MSAFLAAAFDDDTPLNGWSKVTSYRSMEGGMAGNRRIRLDTERSFNHCMHKFLEARNSLPDRSEQ